MDAATLRPLTQLIRSQRTAALGTLREGSPLVTLVLYAFAPDFSVFYLHLSRLAPHTQAILADSRVGLMIAAADDGQTDPQVLARVSIQSEAALIAKTAADYEQSRRLYLTRFPNAQPMFGLGDFDLYQIEPRSARLVTGFAQAYNLALGHFKEAAQIE
jgi:hypothetical protein